MKTVDQSLTFWIAAWFLITVIQFSSNIQDFSYKIFLIVLTLDDASLW